MNTPDKPRRSSSFQNRLCIAGLLLLVALPVCYRGCRGEVDRWRAARIMEAWLDGEKRQAIEQLKTISERLPDDHRLKLVLGEWILDLGATSRKDQHAEEALALVREIPEQFRDRRSEALEQHCLLALGKPEEALKAYQAANPANTTRTLERAIFHKNSLAYYQALAGEELALAYQNSDFVVRKIAGLWNGNQHIPLSAHMQGLFCSAMIYRQQMLRFASDEARQADYADRATTVLSGAIAHLEEEYQQFCRSRGRGERKLVPSPEAWPWIEKKQVVAEDQNSEDPPKSIADQQKDDAAHALATLLTLRALIYQDIGENESSFTDRRRVQKLGFQPETMAGMMPSFSDCVFQLELIAMVLDTRGCVFYKMNQSPAAMADLNIAVIGQQALVDVAEFTPRTGRETSLDPRQQFEMYVRGPQRTLATLLFHRSWARRDENDTTGANADVAAIRELGYEPGHYLF